MSGWWVVVVVGGCREPQHAHVKDRGPSHQPARPQTPCERPSSRPAGESLRPAKITQSNGQCGGRWSQVKDGCQGPSENWDTELQPSSLCPRPRASGEPWEAEPRVLVSSCGARVTGRAGLGRAAPTHAGPPGEPRPPTAGPPCRLRAVLQGPATVSGFSSVSVRRVT